ncbi:MAG: NYN domain-containing protein, partial [Clostridia bacterium]|nr:NYN domain-containing protein [Clostridia bacterium]
GAPITDVTITLVNGKAHQKHTEGGDFRQATYRAVRQGLMQAEGVILEPWYVFRLTVPMENVGRAMTDLEQLGASFDAPESLGEMSVISGSAPIAAIRDYHRSVTQYTHGRGRLTVSFKGYEPCRNSEDIINKFNYNPEADLENTPDSVFCSHGSGFTVKWDKVFEHMHLPALKREQQSVEPTLRRNRSVIADEEELIRIFEKTYGKITRKTAGIMRTKKADTEYKAKPVVHKEEYLLIDGYNIIFAVSELRKIADESLEDARDLLAARLSGYRAMKDKNIILVFDAYKVRGARREIEDIHGVKVVYTKEAETADSYIEKTSRRLVKNYRVRVATSDGLEQMIIFGNGAIRVTPAELMEEIALCEAQIREFIRNNNS